MIVKPTFQKQLIRWFKNHQRVLPWRIKRTPYRTWVSEIMLQQTQVKTMVPFFNKWMRLFPSIKSLAHADNDKLMASWQGLGYYSRARNLKKGAQYILENFDGKVPSDLKYLLQIPGIGAYTAGAIKSLAFNQKAPIVDGNVLRVMSRLHASSRPIDQQKTREYIAKKQLELVDDNEPGQFNEAMMELGALICTPQNPECPICPVKQHCLSLKKNLVNKIPIKSKKIKITKVSAVALIVMNRNKTLLQHRPEGQLMGGLWEFPEWKIGETSKPNMAQAVKALKNSIGLLNTSLKFNKTIKRHYTRFAESLHVFTINSSNPKKFVQKNWQYKWVNQDELTKIGFTSAHSKIRDIILNCHSKK